MLEVGEIYTIRGARVDNAYGRRDLGSIQLTTTPNTHMEHITESAPEFHTFIPRPLSTLTEIQRMKPNEIIDTVVCVAETQDIRTVHSAFNSSLRDVRTLKVVDATIEKGETVTLSLWGNWATLFDPTKHEMIRITSGKLTPYDGALTIQTTTTTLVEFQPSNNEPIIMKMEKWWNDNKKEILSIHNQKNDVPLPQSGGKRDHTCTVDPVEKKDENQERV